VFFSDQNYNLYDTSGLSSVQDVGAVGVKEHLFCDERGRHHSPP
jgi:hypothetical protein